MSETTSGYPRAASEILNTSYDELAALSIDIGHDRQSLFNYIQVMREQSPELTKQIGGWVGVLRESAVQHGLVVAVRAEGAFTAGSAMMYELLRRLAEANGHPIPDGDFLPDSLVDSELPSERPQWLIELSFRGEKLFRDHPPFFDAALDMFRRSHGGEERGDLKDLLFSAPDPADVYSFDLVHYLNGAAETVLPIERKAQIDALER